LKRKESLKGGAEEGGARDKGTGTIQNKSSPTDNREKSKNYESNAPQSDRRKTEKKRKKMFEQRKA